MYEISLQSSLNLQIAYDLWPVHEFVGTFCCRDPQVVTAACPNRCIAPAHEARNILVHLVEHPKTVRAPNWRLRGHAWVDSKGVWHILALSIENLKMYHGIEENETMQDILKVDFPRIFTAENIAWRYFGTIVFILMQECSTDHGMFTNLCIVLAVLHAQCSKFEGYPMGMTWWRMTWPMAIHTMCILTCLGLWCFMTIL